MPTRFSVSLFCTTVSLLVAGCASMRSPARPEPLPSIENYNPSLRAKIRSGILEVGYTPEMVMLTIGPPDLKSLTVAPNGQNENWIYYTYYRRTGKEAERSYPYERRVSYEPPLRAYRVFDLPSVTPTEEQDRSERIRLVFRAGKLAVIEQTKGG